MGPLVAPLIKLGHTCNDFVKAFLRVAVTVPGESP